MKLIVSSGDSSRRILAVTGSAVAALSAATSAAASRGLASSAAPKPLFTEKDLGQPMLTSIPATSPPTTRAAATASSGVATPSCARARARHETSAARCKSCACVRACVRACVGTWRMTRPRSAAHVWKRRK
jgi:hypothetical protein